MRPRVIFAILLALGSICHLALLASPARSLLPLTVYLGWLLLGAVATSIAWAHVQRARRALVRERLIRHQPIPAPFVEGLGWFWATAAAGLATHLINAVGSGTQRSVQNGMWLLAILLALSSYLQLRGVPGDVAAPVPDGSRLAKGVSWLRRGIGLMLTAAGGVVLLVGLQSVAQVAGTQSRAISVLVVLSGAVLTLFGLAIMFARGRSDA